MLTRDLERSIQWVRLVVDLWMPHGLSGQSMWRRRKDVSRERVPFRRVRDFGSQPSEPSTEALLEH